MVSERERRFFDDFVSQQQLKIEQVVNTHLHLDHCFGDNYVRDKYGVKVAANILDAPLAENLQRQAAQFGMVLDKDETVEVDVPLNEGDVISVGNYKIDVLQVRVTRKAVSYSIARKRMSLL